MLLHTTGGVLDRGGTRKITELGTQQCRHPEHNPPSHMYYEDGVWGHICPECGHSIIFTVANPTL
jgi:hypothetical protein